MGNYREIVVAKEKAEDLRVEHIFAFVCNFATALTRTIRDRKVGPAGPDGRSLFARSGGQHA